MIVGQDLAKVLMLTNPYPFTAKVTGPAGEVPCTKRTTHWWWSTIQFYRRRGWSLGTNTLFEDNGSRRYIYLELIWWMYVVHVMHYAVIGLKRDWRFHSFILPSLSKLLVTIYTRSICLSFVLHAISFMIFQANITHLNTGFEMICAERALAEELRTSSTLAIVPQNIW